MKKQSIFLIMLVLLIGIYSHDLNAQEISRDWEKFFGGSGSDEGYDIALDASGNIYLAGMSDATWGSPVNVYYDGGDGFVARLNSSGNLVWNTFLGSSAADEIWGIALSASGYIFVVGTSEASWGSPLNAHSGGKDVFVACLSGAGALLYNTFLGSSLDDEGDKIVIDGSGNIIVVGQSHDSWGSPVIAFNGSTDIFVAALDSSLNLLWNTFMGSSGSDYGPAGCALSPLGKILVTGTSTWSWGWPLNPFSAGSAEEVFVACLNKTGNLLWNTFMGSEYDDEAVCITVGSLGHVLVCGWSDDSWGSPINAFSGQWDTFVARLDSSGNLLWNTFMGGGQSDLPADISVDGSGNIVVVGTSTDSWGSPIYPYSGNDTEAFVACLAGSGNRIWNTFMGCIDSDQMYGVALTDMGNIFSTGWTWPGMSSKDIFLSKISVYPLADIQANWSDGPISITQSDVLQVRVSLNRFGSGKNVDYWLAYRGPSGWVYYNSTAKSWMPGLNVTHQGVLMDMKNKKVFQASGLAPGIYRFYFGVDLVMNGEVNKGSLYKDEVQVTVTSN